MRAAAEGAALRGALAIAAACALGLGVLAPASRAAEPAAAYDRAGVLHNEQCVATASGGPVAVRDAEGEELQTASGPLVDPPEQGETCAAAPGVRLQGIEAVATKAMTMYYSWPLEGGGQAPGFIAADELAVAPAVSVDDAAGNGTPAPPSAGEPAYAVAPQDIASEQRYRGPLTGRWYTYSVYGRSVGAARFALMMWSWIDVAGGGIARAAVAEGELFHPADVQPLTTASSGGAGQSINGTVTVRYGYVFNGVEKLYGWMVTSHTLDGICYDHMIYAGGGAPLAGTLCPSASAGAAVGVSPAQTVFGATLPGASEVL